MSKRKSNRVETGKGKSGCASVNGYTARLEQLKAKQNEKRIDEIEKMLDEAGVPEWVENSDSNGVPSNAPQSRLKWFLARRKNVTAREIDQKLQREMKENLEYERRYNDQADLPTPEE